MISIHGTKCKGLVDSGNSWGIAIPAPMMYKSGLGRSDLCTTTITSPRTAKKEACTTNITSSRTAKKEARRKPINTKPRSPSHPR